MADTKPGGQATPDPAGTPAAGTPPAGQEAPPAPKPGTEGTPAPKGTEGDPAAPGKGTPAADPSKPKAPESYTLKAPDGADLYVDDTLIATVSKVAKANGWTNEEAQAALEEHVGALQAESEAFRTATAADPDYGGDKLEETQKLARRAIDRVRPKGHARAEQFNKLLTRTGYGNHIEVVSFLADLGRLMGEDSPAGGRVGGDKPVDLAEKLYGKNPTQ